MVEGSLAPAAGADEQRRAGLGCRERGDRAGALEHFRSAAELDPENPWNALAVAEELRELGRLDEAEKQLREIAARRPQFAAARQQLGTIARRRGDRAGAFEHFRTAAELDPENPWNALAVAEELRELGRLDEAEKQLGEIIARRPQFAPAWQQLGMIARRRGDRAGALERFRTAAELDPENQWNPIDIAEELRELGRLDEAEKELREITVRRPQFAAAWRQLGMMARNRGDREGALELFRAAAQLDPENQWNPIDVAEELRGLGRLDEAEKQLREITVGRPQFAAAWRQLGMIARHRGDRAGALERFRTAAELDPENPWSALGISEELRELGRLDEAEKQLGEIIARRPQFAPAWQQLGMIARRRGDRAGALEHFRTAAELDPENPWSALGIAEELRELERLDEAEKQLGEIIARRPQFAAAWRQLGTIARSRGDRDAALKHFRSAAELDPRDPWHAYAAAEMLRELGQLDEAEKLAGEITLRHPQLPAPWRLLGSIARSRGDREGALNHFRAAAEFDPNDPWHAIAAAEVLRELDRLDEAEKLLSEIAARHPRLPAPWRFLASIARTRGDREGALKHFRAAAELDPENQWNPIDIAEELRELGRLDEAEQQLREITRRSPQFPAAWRQLGMMARNRGDREGALELFRAAAQLDPDNQWNPIDVAEELRGLGRLDEAEKQLREITVRRPQFAAAWRQLGMNARHRGDRTGALELFRSAALHAPDDAGCRFEIASELLNMGRFEEAEDVARALVEARPEQPFGWRALASVAIRRGDHEEALKQLRAASARAPDDLWLKSEIAGELMELGRFDEAEEIFNALVEARPQLAVGWRGLGELARRRGDPEQALARLRRAAELSPQDLWLHAAVVAEMNGLQRVSEAEAYASKIAARHLGSAVAQVTLAQSSRRRLSSAETLAMFEKAVAIEPAAAHAKLALAAEYTAVWRLDEAEALYESILATDPRNPNALVGVVQVARRRGDRGKSLRILSAALEAAPDNVWIAIEYARDLVDAGRLAEADQCLSALLERNPHRPAVLVFLGQTARMNGDGKTARRYFEAAVELAGANDNATIELALEEYRAGEVEAALRRLQDLVARRPDNAQAHDVLADIAQALHEVDAAYQHRAAALGIDDAQLWRRLNLARLETAMGRREEASAILKQCEERYGLLPEIALAQVHFAKTTGEPEAALARLTTARAAFPTHFEIWFQWVRELMENGAFEQALRAVEQPPDCSVRERARSCFLRGLILWAQWRHLAASEQFAAAAAVLPGDGWIHDAAAKTALALGDVETAVAHLEAQTRNDPAHRVTHAGGAKPLQTHAGQVLDEYRIDSSALTRLREASASADPVGAFQRLVVERPDYTPAAIGLLISLRQQGRLAAGASSGGPIPRKIWQYWDQAIPRDIERLCEEWRQRNPDFQYRRLSKLEAQQFLSERGPRGAREAFDLAIEPAMKADLLRLALLRHEGGFYIDADDRGLKPLAEIDPGGCDLLLYQEDFGTVGNNFIGAVPGQPAIALALESAIAAILRGDADLLWLSTGPGLLTRSLARALAADLERTLPRVRIFERHELYRSIAMHCVSSYKQSGKHWGKAAFGKRRRAGRAR